MAQSLQRLPQQDPGTSPCLQESSLTLHSSAFRQALIKCWKNGQKQFQLAPPKWKRSAFSQGSYKAQGLTNTGLKTGRQIGSAPPEPQGHGVRVVWFPTGRVGAVISCGTAETCRGQGLKDTMAMRWAELHTSWLEEADKEVSGDFELYRLAKQVMMKPCTQKSEDGRN